METFVKVKMRENPDGPPEVQVRRWVVADDGKVHYKEFLKPDGTWVIVPELGYIPQECSLPVAMYSSVKDFQTDMRSLRVRETKPSG